MTRSEFRQALVGRPCYLGLDLSSTTDLTALVGIFPDEDRFDVLAQFFVPQENIRQRSTRDHVPYDQWERDGDLVSTPGNVVDYEAVRRVINEWRTLYQIKEIAFDPYNATDLVTRLKEHDGFTCVQINQGFKIISPPTKSLERSILSKRLRHDGHPILRWCISNAAVQIDADGNIKLNKAFSTGRIDGASALVMAVSRMDVTMGIKTHEPQLLLIGETRAT